MQTIIKKIAGLVLVSAGLAGCGVDGQDAPSLIGPSGFAQTVSLTASPDRLARDGSSQSVVTVTVRNESGEGVAGQRVTLGSSAGTLSQSEVVTGSDGRATVTVTAPPADSVGNTIDVFATPDSANAITRTLQIALLGTSNTTVPTAAFTVSPAAPGAREVVTFDASATTDEGIPCGTACTYSWNFGDGTATTGIIVTHSYATPGTYLVVLTVIDAADTTATAQRTLAVSSVAPPSVTFAVSPASPFVGQLATFTATGSPAAGHSITQYSWDFGDGMPPQTSASRTMTKTFSTAGSRVVTVTATDDLSHTGSASATVTVTTGVTATIRFSPTNPIVNQTVRFDPSDSTVPAGITVSEYRWDFGNGQTQTTTPSSPIAQTQYSTAQTFTVRLSIVDTEGRVTNAFTSVPVSED